MSVWPMGASGQQAPDLWFKAAVKLDQSLDMASLQAWVRTPSARCLGGGILTSFTGGVERSLEANSLSNSGLDPAPCTLPFTTTQVEFTVLDTTTGTVVLRQSFPATYTFVAGH